MSLRNPTKYTHLRHFRRDISPLIPGGVARNHIISRALNVDVAIENFENEMPMMYTENGELGGVFISSVD